MTAAADASAITAGGEGLGDSIFFPACGKQSDGMKQNMPLWTLPTGSRDDAKKVFISKKHPQDLLGKDSPGFAYRPRRQKSLPSWGFGSAEARPPMMKPGGGEPMNNPNVDGQPFKFKTYSVGLGRAPRDAAANSPEFEGFPAGTLSPGPGGYSPETNSYYSFRFGHAKNIDHIPPSWTMRQKTKIIELEPGTPANLGPGVYPIPQSCGKQCDSTRPSLPMWKINRVDRGTGPGSMKSTSGKLWDGMGAQMELNKRSFSRSPSFGFGTSTRQNAMRMARCTTTLDEGPAGQMEKHPARAPSIGDTHYNRLKLSEVPCG